jgi:hypothetical protein
MSKEIVLPKNGHKITFIEEPTGEFIIDLEKTTKSMIDLSSVTEGGSQDIGIGFNKDNVKVIMEYAHRLIDTIEDADGKFIPATLGYVQGLGKTDYMAIKEVVEEMTEDLDFL